MIPISFLALFASAGLFADTHEEESNDKLIATRFAKCAAYYSLKEAGEIDATKKHAYRNISVSNAAFAAAFSNAEFTKTAIIQYVKEMLDEIKRIPPGRLGEYGQGITATCALLLTDNMPELKAREFAFR